MMGRDAAERQTDRAERPRRAEPKGIGSAGAADPLAREVKLLGSLLGQVIAEQEGRERFELVERLRATAVRQRRGTDATPAALAALDALGADDLAVVARAFTAYFLLINLAEEKQRVRILRRRQRQNAGRPLADGVEAAFESLAGARVPGGEVRALLERMELRPVLTAHPTEARRRTVLVAQRRIYRLLDRLDDLRLTPAEDGEIRRRLREEITILWQTAPVREQRPTPLDEVRAAMVFFDETIFVAAPRLIRAVDEAAPRERDEKADRPLIGSFLRFGSWIGADRDGHPGVTAETTRATQRIQADHLLRGYRNVAERLQQTIAVSADQADVPAAVRRRLTDALRAFPAARSDLARRFPGQPYRQAFGLMAERLERTRRRLTGERGARRGAYASPDELLDDLRAIQSALAAHAAQRVAWGEVQDLAWQVETFGFHLASLEVRQHAEVHEAALARLRGGGDLEAPLAGDSGPSTREVLATLSTMAELQRRVAPATAHRYVISFTRRPDDVLAVLDLAARALSDDPARAPNLRAADLPIDVVPLFESRDALGEAGPLLASLLDDPTYRAHLERRGNRQEVMLGYSDSNKEVGYLAAAWSLHQAQAALVDAAHAAGVELTLFHGRGGSIGRGGGPANRAVLAQAPGSVDGRLKVTEQGEVIAERYPSPAIALRHLEQLTNATLLASFVPTDRHATFIDRFGPMLGELAELAEAAYRRLVWDDPAFAAYYAAATPIGEITRLQLGSRPARRSSAGDGVPDLEALRAIPWAFAWSQSRANVPAWYGVGTALDRYVERHGRRGRDQLAEAHRDWPFFSTTIENVELGLAVADPSIASRYAGLAGDAAPMGRVAAAVADEYARTERGILAVTGHQRLMDRSPRLQRSIALRNPYVDVLSEVQLRCLRRLRAARADDGERHALERLLQLTVSGIAAGLQHTG